MILWRIRIGSWEDIFCWGSIPSLLGILDEIESLCSSHTPNLEHALAEGTLSYHSNIYLNQR